MPFTQAQFLRVMAQYNEAVWPAQIVLVVLALLVLARPSNTFVAGALALLWAWMGLAYHVLFFTRINPAAWLFGAAFVAQSALFVRAAAKGRLVLDAPRGAAGAIAIALLVYALIAYPALGLAFGHRYPEAPTFGLPCPTTIFTFGVLALAQRTRAPIALYVVPVLWALVGTTAALRLGVPQDFGLLVAAVAAIALRGYRALPRHQPVG